MNSSQSFYFIILMLLVSPVSAENLKSFQLPEFNLNSDMKVQWVARKMIYNSKPMSIQQFHSSLSAKEIIRFYNHHWQYKGNGLQKPVAQGEYQMLAYEHDGHVFSVQVKNINGGSEGELVVTRNRSYQQGPIAFPLHHDAKVVTRIHSLDMGTKSETITVSHTHLSNVSEHWYRNALIRKGWSNQDNGSSISGNQAMYQKGKQLCQLIFMDNSSMAGHQSMVMIHWIKG